ncbi:flagellar assembly protein FliW [soil metagenome]
MNIVTTRFGTIQVPNESLLLIPEGLVGFRSYTQFVYWVDPEVEELYWLQSATEPGLAFALVPPPISAGDYRVELRPGDRASLELEDERDAIVQVILNRGDGGLTVNLQGPLVINPVRRLGRQLVLTSSRYAVRYPLGSPDAPPTLLPGPVALRATA